MKILSKIYNAKTGRDEYAIVDLSPIARALGAEAMAFLLEKWANTGQAGYAPGVRIGRLLHHTHRHLQAEIIDTLLGICAGMGEQEHGDARNAFQLGMARQVATMVGIPPEAIPDRQ